MGRVAGVRMAHRARAGAACARVLAGPICAGLVALASGPCLADLPARGARLAVDPTPAGVSARLRDVVESMARHVRAPDDDAYLAHVHGDDPVLLTEQRNWIADVVDRPPEAFDLEIDAGSVEPGEGAESATARLTATWRMPGGPRREVSFPARFVVEAGRWKYAGRAWEELGGERVVVKHAGGLEPVARKVLEQFPEVAEHVERGFGLERGEDFPASRVQQIKLYGSMGELQYSIYPSYRDPLGGWNEPGESMKLLAQPGSRFTDQRPLLAHEYGHVVTFMLGPHASEAPWWVLEGVAELAAERFAGRGAHVREVVEAWAGSGRLVGWEELADFRGIDPRHQVHVYFQGHSMLGYVSDRFGRSGRNAWLRAMARGASLEEATRAVLGIAFDELDEGWRASISSRDGLDSRAPAGR